MSSIEPLISPSSLIDLSLKSVLLMSLACIVVVFLRKASAAWRHLVWFLGVASLLLLPVLSAFLPTWRVTGLPQWGPVQAHLVTTLDDSTITRQSIARNDHDTSLVPVVQEDHNIAENDPVPEKFLLDKQASQDQKQTLAWMADGFVIVWFTGMLVSFVPLVIGLCQLSILRRHSRVIDDPRWTSLLAELQNHYRMCRRVQLRQCDDHRSPMTWGAFALVVLIPLDANRWTDDRQRMVLLHELAHIRRCDWLTQVVAHVSCSIYWFNPLVWFAARKMQIERERACDDLVLSSGASASDYAQELVWLASSLSHARLSNLAAVPMARRNSLEDRIGQILDCGRCRSALTTWVVSLAVVLAAAAITPLAMLRAATPKSTESSMEQDESDAKQQAADKAPIEETDQRDPTPEEMESRKTGIRISVLNAKGDKGIPEFRVIAGVSSGSVSAEFEKQTSKVVVNWQPHTCRVGKNGDYVWPLANAYDEMALRVEADGYQPQVFTNLKKAIGPQHVVFMLKEDDGIKGRVLTPAGKPAEGATVAMAIPHQEIVWEGRKLRGEDEPLPEHPADRWRRPRFVKTDQDGTFRLPTEFDPAAVLIVHFSGVKEIAYEAWQKSPEVTLDRWGAIAGQVLWQNQPGAEEEISCSIHRDEYGYPGMISSYFQTRTDQMGRFAIRGVLPGRAQISRPFMVTGSPQISQVILEGVFQHVTVSAGDITSVVLGGQGRNVSGRFVGLDSWEGATYHFHPTAPHIGFGGDDAMWKAFREFQESAIGPVFFRDKQPINKDGTFTIEKMLPGRYQLFVTAPGFKNYVVLTKVEIKPEVLNEKPAALDLGDIAAVNKLVKDDPVQEPPLDDRPNDKPNEKSIEKPAVKKAEPQSNNVVTIRGKVVDDVTGEPIERVIIQGGKFEPADPKNVTWGFSEGRSNSRDGLFSTSIRWSEGWTARIIADGYEPQPVVASAPAADKKEFEVTIRLKRGSVVRGVVIDDAGNPVKKASVFAIGPTGLNLAGGNAISTNGGNDVEAQPVRTDEKGRFEISVGEAKSLAVSHTTIDAWPAAIPASGDLTIRLPKAAQVEVELAIDGAEKESTIFYQLLTSGRPEFDRLQSTRELKITNPGKLTLPALPPGRYQLSRNVMNRLGQMGFGKMLERQFFELKAGEMKSIKFVRETGARVRGKVTWPAEAKLMGTVVSVRGLVDQKSPFDEHAWPVVYASHVVGKDGSFQTERISPGKYLLVAKAYTVLTPEQQVRSGFVGPSHGAEMKIDVTADGELTVNELVLKSIKANINDLE